MPRYPYTVLPAKDRSVFKPLIKVSLNYKRTHKITYPITALIDSGADVCFCSKDIGIWLGIQFGKNKNIYKFTAANNCQFSTKKEILSLYACDKSYQCPFFFSDNLPPNTPVILGQYGFFDHFKITFDIQNKVIEIV